MPRVKIGPAQPERKTIDIEIARLRDLELGDLQVRWHTVLGRRPSPHLPRHILFRVLAYRLQADHFGDLDAESKLNSMKVDGDRVYRIDHGTEAGAAGKQSRRHAA